MAAWTRLVTFGVLFAAAFSPTSAYAEWLIAHRITRINTYPAANYHYVWTSGGSGGECAAADPANPVLCFFNNDVGGSGKATYATLLAAMLLGKTVDIQANQCYVVEVRVNQ